MRQKRPQIDAVRFHKLHETPHPFFSSGTKSRNNGLISKSSVKTVQRHKQMAGVDAQARENPSWSENSQSTFEW